MLAPVRADPAPGRRLAALDGLRGLAILMVMSFHFWGLLPGLTGGKSTAWLDTHLAPLFGAGWIGVDLFFVISGLLITGNLYDARGSRSYFTAFYARRFLRIFPLYYGFLILVLFVAPRCQALVGPLQVEALGKVQGYYWTYTLNVLGALKATSKLVPLSHTHFWSLCAEEQFFLLWPVVVRFGGDRERLMRVFLCLIVTALALRWLVTSDVAASVFDRSAPYSLMPCRIDAFAVGGYLALAARGDAAEVVRVSRLAPYVAAGAFLVLAAIGASNGRLHPFDRPVNTIGFLLLAITCGGLLVAVQSGEPGSRLRRIFDGRVLTTIGKYSYGIYVVHLGVAFALIPQVVHEPWTNALGGSYVLANLGFAMLAGGASLLLAWGSWHLLEKRALALKRYFPYGAAVERVEEPSAQEEAATS